MLGYHNHNFFCDGEKSIEEYLQEAVKQGFNAFGVSSHAPFNFFNKWSISTKNLNKYTSEIDFFKEKYAEKLTVLKSLEIDFAPGFINGFDYFKEKYQLDYTIGSIHYVVHPKTKELLFIDGPKKEFDKNLQKYFNGNLRYAVETYFEQTKQMISKENPDIIGHIDKIVMNSGLLPHSYPDWYLKQIEELLDFVAGSNSIIELNLRGLIKEKWSTTFLDEQFLPLCRQTGIRFVISADAHRPDEIGLYYNYAAEALINAGIETIMQFKGNRWNPISLNKSDNNNKY